LPSFGEKLKLEREKRKITLEQISSSTKIGIRMLQALEEDRFNQLPGGIFNKGFVRAYSHCVGLDEDQTVADYLQASGDAPPVSTEIAAREDGARENAENVNRLEAISDAPARQLPWGLFAALLLVIALALSLWSHRRREHASQSLRPAATTAATQVAGEVSRGVSGEDSGAASPRPGSPTASSPTNSSPATGSPTGGYAPSVRPAAIPASGKPSSVVPKTPQGLAPQSLAAAAPAATPGEFTVIVQAREESWISVTVDGRTVSSELLAAGSEHAIRGRKEIIVKAGNAGAVDFRFNGKKLDTGGEFGEVKTVTFGPQGIIPNAPAPPSTP
jgi:cytoskeleton protein RodZ